MSNRLPHYCGHHNENFALACSGCDREWVESLSEVEKALAAHVSQPGLPLSGCRAYIANFRKMELAA